MKSQPVVFCDFDGTITAVETFAGMLKALAPSVADRVMPELYARRMTLRDGVREMLEAIPSDRYEEVIGYADDKPVREGFGEFVAFLGERDIPFVIVSGGVREMVERVMNRLSLRGKPLRHCIAEIIAVEVDAEGDWLRVPSQAFEGETELVAKARVMERYPGREWVAIGDSVTDINMAMAADRVFARDRLLDYLKIEGKACVPWNDFFDILHEFEQQGERSRSR